MKQRDVTYKTPEQPNQVRLDTIAKCNATCKSCHRFNTKRSGEMSWDMIWSILHDIAKWKTPLREIVPVNYGEFFLHREWYSILRAISTILQQTNIVIPTNGSKLTPKVITGLSEIPTLRMMNFSVNAYFEDNYEDFMGLPASNLQNIEDSIKTLKTLRPDIITWVSMVFDPMYQTDLERDFFTTHWSKIADKVWAIPAASANRKDKSPMKPVLAPCRSLFSDFVIGYDGRLSSCCFDAGFTLDVGNYSGDIILDWKNPDLENLRTVHNTHNRDKFILCQDCTYA